MKILDRSFVLLLPIIVYIKLEVTKCPPDSLSILIQNVNKIIKIYKLNRMAYKILTNDSYVSEITKTSPHYRSLNNLKISLRISSCSKIANCSKFLHHRVVVNILSATYTIVIILKSCIYLPNLAEIKKSRHELSLTLYLL